MTITTKAYYRIREVAAMLDIQAHTLRFWEDEFPMFNPDRTPSGQRRFTPEQVELAKRIKELLYDKGLKIDAAVKVLNATYRKYPPRQKPVCRTSEDAIRLLRNVRDFLEDDHAAAKIDAVIEFCKCCANVAQSVE